MGTAALTCVAVTKVVGRGEPFHWTTAPCANPVPVTPRVKAGMPAMTEAGLRDVIAGGALMVKVTVDVVVPAEFTATVAVPAIATRLAGI